MSSTVNSQLYQETIFSQFNGDLDAVIQVQYCAFTQKLEFQGFSSLSRIVLGINLEILSFNVVITF